MRNDVSFPPDPNAPDDDAGDARPTPRGNVARTNGRAAGATHARNLSPTQPPGPTHPHAADRAHSLEKTRDRPATGMIYETPEDRGGIDSTMLSIIVVAIVAIGLLIVGWTVWRGADDATKAAPGPTVPNATIVDDKPAEAENR